MATKLKGVIDDFWDTMLHYKYQRKEEDLKGRQRPLFHYTGATGLHGILSSNRLWATHIEFLNDSLELTYGKQFIQDYIDQKLIAAKPEVEKELLLQVAQFMKVKPIDKECDVYIACFCENGDLLSQWRGYGDFGKGYALGFDSTKLVPMYRRFPSCNIMIRPVVYQAKDQQVEVDNLVQLAFRQITLALEQGKEEKKTILHEFAAALSYGLRNLAYLFKSEKFQEEREWRAIYLNGDNTEERRQSVKFRIMQELIIPYMEFDLTPSAGAEQERLPIVNIVCGPGVNYPCAEKSLRMLLQAGGFQGVQITKSQIPFR